MDADKRKRIEAALADKPARYLDLVYLRYGRPDASFKELGESVGLKASSAAAQVRRIFKDAAVEAAWSIINEVKADDAEDKRAAWLDRLHRGIARFEKAEDDAGNLVDNNNLPMSNPKAWCSGMDMLAKVERLYAPVDGPKGGMLIFENHY